MSFARRMENEVATPNKRTEAPTPSLTAKSVALNAKSMAFLLAPCILFLWAAAYAVIYGTDYANTPQEDAVVARHRKDAEIRKIVAANIAAGDPFPSRKLMLEELDARDERTKGCLRVVYAANRLCSHPRHRPAGLPDPQTSGALQKARRRLRLILKRHQPVIPAPWLPKLHRDLRWASLSSRRSSIIAPSNAD